MPVFIGVVSGLLDGLGISLFSKGETLLGAAWFLMGIAVAGVIYLRIRDDQRAAVKAEVKHREE